MGQMSSSPERRLCSISEPRLLRATGIIKGHDSSLSRYAGERSCCGRGSTGCIHAFELGTKSLSIAARIGSADSTDFRSKAIVLTHAKERDLQAVIAYDGLELRI
jgi:hypothetical protein